MKFAVLRTILANFSMTKLGETTKPLTKSSSSGMDTGGNVNQTKASSHEKYRDLRERGAKTARPLCRKKKKKAV